MRSLLLALALVLGVGACSVGTAGPLTRDALLPVEKRGADQADYVAGLVRRAHAQRLSASVPWMRLGHWKKGLLGGRTSEADGGNFFLAPTGVDDPGAELDATIRAFFSTLPPGVESTDVANPAPVQHPICQFPARFLWLDQQLGFDRARLPPHDCTRFEQFRGVADVSKISFVFSSYYLNNPASVFGHTFIRLVNKRTATGEKRELIDRAIEFSAEVDTSNALVYGIKGIVGLFPGTFRNVPYYFKVRQYNDVEARDLYEYELGLTPAEMDLFVAHLWELGSTYFDYYYVSENCSYHLLGALEVARPSLELLAHMHWPVVPADTIKALHANPGLVKEIKFRPSLRRQFRARVADMPPDDVELVDEIAHDPEQPLPAALPTVRKANILDAAQDLIDVLHVKQITFSATSEPAQRKQRLLERRAELLVPSARLAVPTPFQSMPQFGHHSRRLGVGYVVDSEGAQSYELSARLALHDLADPTPGYPEQSQLEFLPVRARIRMDAGGEGHRFTLESLSLVKIISLSRQDAFDRKLSWKADFGVARLTDEGCEGDSCYVGRVTAGTGVTFGTASNRLLVFATVDGTVQSGPSLDGINGWGLRAGVGPAGGLRLRLTPRLISLTTGELYWLPTQAPTFLWEARSTLRFAFGPMFALDLGGLLDARAFTGNAAALVYF